MAMCGVCKTERPLAELLEVACLPHDGQHHHYVCRPSINRQDRIPENCFRRGTASHSVHRIGIANAVGAT